MMETSSHSQGGTTLLHKTSHHTQSSVHPYPPHSNTIVHYLLPLCVHDEMVEVLFECTIFPKVQEAHTTAKIFLILGLIPP